MRMILRRNPDRKNKSKYKDMNKKVFTGASLCALMLAGAGLTACGGDAAKEVKKPVAAAQQQKAGLPNYRYVDLDTILSRYNLAKDYNEEMLRMQTQLDNQAKKHQNSLQSMAGKMQNKVQNNGYLTRESFEQDQQNLANAQASAERQMMTLQQNAAKAAETAQNTVNDSIQAFIKEYNARHGYDAIFFKAATLYIDPALDITEEVVEGLNARYNKVNKK